MAINGSAIASRVLTTENILTWTAPAVAIPGLRYTQDSQQNRKELFIRDASTYSIGALTFFLVRQIARKGMDYFHLFRSNDTRYLIAFLIGLTANLLYAGIGAVKFSHAFSRYQNRKAQHPNLSPSNSSSLQAGIKGALASPSHPIPPMLQQFHPTTSPNSYRFFIPGPHAPSTAQAWGSPRLPLDGKVQYLA